MALLSTGDRVRRRAAAARAGRTGGRWTPSTTSATSSASTAGRWPGRRARCAATSRRSSGCSPRSPSAPARSAVIGGTVGVIAFLSFFTGTEVGLQGYAALDQLGTSAFTGFLSAYFNTREIAPLVAGLALSATVGCGFTAQLGAMRINEEIDALEVMGVPSLPFLVTTRIIAGFVAVIPLYVLGLLSSYFATRTIATQAYGQSTGTYDHYFNLFLPPEDVLWSFLQGARLRRRDHPDPLLLRLPRQRRPGGRRRGRRPRGALLDRRGQHHRLLPVAGHLGRDDDRADRGVSAR